MRASTITSVPQFSQGLRLRIEVGTGTDYSNPMSENIISGTHTQCTSLLVGFWWLAQYSERSEGRGGPWLWEWQGREQAVILPKQKSLPNWEGFFALATRAAYAFALTRNLVRR
jgi:hypothetical protein